MSVRERDVLERLAAGAGTWRGEERFPDPKEGREILAEAWSRARVVSQGRILVTDHRQTVDGEVVMEGHSVTTWAPSRRAVVMYFFDGSGEPPSVYTGGYHGGALVLEGAGPEGSRIRHRTSHPGPDPMRTVSALSFDGGEHWTEIFTGDYVRVG